MQCSPELRPTSWRTCRALANQKRLLIFGILLQEPDQTVSDVAENCDLTLPAASEYLRLLESRGLLKARRLGRFVRYRVMPADRTSLNADLVRALRTVFERNTNPILTVFQLVTAFTHPRRIEIFRALRAGATMMSQLRAVTGISLRALGRHLVKLERRRFVKQLGDNYSIIRPSNPLRRELIRLTES